MKTPYGEIPERLVKDMSAQDMHDYLRKRYCRRQLSAREAWWIAGRQATSTTEDKPGRAPGNILIAAGHAPETCSWPRDAQLLI
jgi:hypothetical protein